MKRVVALFLSLCCMMFLFAGCKKPSIENPDTSISGQTEPTTNNTEPTTEETVEQTEPIPLTLPEGTPLTADELAWFYDEFFTRDWVDEHPDWLFNTRNMYMQIEFASVEEIDMGLLFRNGVRPTKEPVTQEEIDAFQQATGRTVSKEVIKIPNWDIQMAYLHTTSKSFLNSQMNGSDKLIYLEEYDAYYIERGDFVEPAYTIKEGVKLQGGFVVMLLYESKLGDSTKDWIVTLHSHKDTYVFVSNLPCSG